MVIKNLKLGGSDFSTPSARVKPTDLNDTFDASADLGLRGLTVNCLNHIRTLIDRAGVYSKGSFDLWGEAYISATGRNGSVNTTSTGATFSTNKYAYKEDATNSTADTKTSASTSGGSTTTWTTTCTAASAGYISQITLGVYSGGSTKQFKVSIIVGGVTLASKNSSTYTSDANLQVTFTKADYLRYIKNGETFLITIANGDSYSMQCYPLTSQSYTGSLFSYSNQTICGVNSGGPINWVTFQGLTLESYSSIIHAIPTGTFSATMSKLFLAALVQDWETGADIKYKLYNTIMGSPSALTCPSVTTSGSQTTEMGYNYSATTECWVISVTKHASCTATRAVIGSDVANFSGNVATFASPVRLAAGSTGSILAGSNGSSYTRVFLSGVTYGSNYELNGLTLTSGNSVSGSDYAENITSISVAPFAENETTGFLDCGITPKKSMFTAFTSEPTTLFVKLEPKSSSPTLSYPSIRGVSLLELFE
jgi:hypothetical protein